MQLRRSAFHTAWPLYAAAARIHRRTLARRPRFVAVVGSFGKSTSARATAACLGLDPTRVDQSNIFSSIPWAVLRTPPGASHSVLEVGIDRPNQMRDYARVIRPDLVVVTSIGSEHHSSLGDIETTRHEKAEMVRQLGPAGTAVLNGDDPNVLWMASQTPARVVRFGLGESCQVRASEVRLDWPEGTRFVLHVGSETRKVRLRLLGRPMVYAALAGIAAAVAEERPLDEIVSAIERLPPTPGRLQCLPLEGGALLLRDDIKSAPETVEAALDLLEEIPARRKHIVMGEISEPVGRQGPAYRKLAERMTRIADRIVVLGGSHQHHSMGVLRRGLGRESVIDARRDVALAAESIRKELQAGDVVLVKGRDTQRLVRVSMLLSGRKVRCDIALCRFKLACERCPMLESGWQGRPAPP
jgi:UDP-N-acetylmuramoyl-tripeptide--D-alanyl-D-alanine ligase